MDVVVSSWDGSDANEFVPRGAFRMQFPDNSQLLVQVGTSGAHYKSAVEDVPREIFTNMYMFLVGRATLVPVPAAAFAYCGYLYKATPIMT